MSEITMKGTNAKQGVELNTCISLELKPMQDVETQKKTKSKAEKDPRGRLFFTTLNNPENLGYTGSPKQICEKLKEEFVACDPMGNGAWVYSISEDNLSHVHMVLEPPKQMRLHTFRKLYNLHADYRDVEPGKKADSEDYLYKTGKYKERPEKVLAQCRYGEISGKRPPKNQWTHIRELFEKGYTTRKILEEFPKYGRYEKEIRAREFDVVRSQRPVKNSKNVHYICASGGCGKSELYNHLCQQNDTRDIFRVNHYEKGAFDNYSCERVLLMDNFMGQIKPEVFFDVLSEVDAKIPARYLDTPNFWEDVYILSPYPLEDVYEKMVPMEKREEHPLEKLLAYITDVTFLERTWKGEYIHATYTIAQYMFRNR